MEKGSVTVARGETVLLREGDVCRWVFILSVKDNTNGTQTAIIRHVDRYGRGKQRRVTVGGTAFVERTM